ncbi:MAG: alpha/beta fold hydrolase [Gammaproteobacteria bacterium]|nr:alpha/beta fold hydrolase [Gammaproteobacteria bacterium]
MPHIRLNSTEFYYELSGKGHPLVFVTGYAADHFFWSPILAELEKHFQVLVFDHRGVGQTRDQESHPLTAQIMAEDVLGLIKALGLKKPHIVGQSMGGTIVQHLAAHHPDTISKLAILNSTLKWRKAMLLGLQSMLNVMRDGCPFDTFFDLNLSWVYGEAFLQNQTKVAFLKNLFLNNSNPPTLPSLERQYHTLTAFDGRPTLAKIKAPTLVVSGLEDIISLPYESREIAEGIPGSKLVELFCGHGITAEMPEELAQVLKEFLLE